MQSKKMLRWMKNARHLGRCDFSCVKLVIKVFLLLSRSLHLRNILMLLMWDIGVGEWVWIMLVNGTEWKKIMDSNPTICEEKLTTSNPSLIKNPHIPDDGSAEPKRYSVDWLCFSINPYFLFGLLVVNFSSQIVGLLSIIFFHIYIYIYIYIYICLAHK